MTQDDESDEIEEMEIEDLDPDMDQLDDVSSPQFLTRFEFIKQKWLIIMKHIIFNKGHICTRNLSRDAVEVTWSQIWKEQGNTRKEECEEYSYKTRIVP